MIRSTSLTIVFAVVIACGSARAQQVITLDEAVKIAVANNRDLKISELEKEKADYQVNQAYGLAMPNVTASADYARAIKKQVMFFDPSLFDPEVEKGTIIPIEIGSNHSLMMGFSATQTLFNAAVFTGVGTAKIYRKAADEMYNATYQRTIAGTKRAFYQVLFMKDVLILTRASFSNAQKNLDNVKILNDQGLVSDYDMIRADVQTENVRPMVTQAESNVVQAENGLKITLGLAPDKAIEVDGEMNFVPVDQALLERSEEMLLSNNASLKALDYQKQVNDEVVDIYRSDYLPTIAAYGNYMWMDQRNELNKFALNNLVPISSVGINISVNLFNGWQTTSKIDAAKMDYRKSEETYEYTKDAMRTQLQTIRFRLDEARKRVEAQRRTVGQAEKGYEIASTRYASGSGTQLEVNDADVALMQARVNRAQAIFDYNLAKVDLEELLNIQ